LETAKKTSEEIKSKYNVVCEAFRVDVSDVEQVEKLRDDIKKRNLNEVDILVNNAGILAPYSILEGKHSDIQRLINVNLIAHFWVK
jgi:short-subunit dehydrogenase